MKTKVYVLKKIGELLKCLDPGILSLYFSLSSSRSFSISFFASYHTLKHTCIFIYIYLYIYTHTHLLILDDIAPFVDVIWRDCFDLFKRDESYEVRTASCVPIKNIFRNEVLVQHLDINIGLILVILL